MAFTSPGPLEALTQPCVFCGVFELNYAITIVKSLKDKLMRDRADGIFNRIGLVSSTFHVQLLDNISRFDPALPSILLAAKPA